MLHLLTGISNANSVLLQKEDINLSLQKLVEELGKATDVDRCYIFTNKTENDELKLYYTHEWCNEGIEIQLGNPDLSGVTYDFFPGLYETLVTQNPFYGLVKDSTNLFFKEIMESQDIKVYLFTPIFCDNDFWGWMGYDDCKNEHTWQPEEVEALFTVAKNIGLRLLREKTERKFAIAQERFNLTVFASQQGIWEWDLVDNTLRFSEKLMEMVGYAHYEFEHTYENWRKRVHPEDLDRIITNLKKYFNKEISSFSNEFRMQHKNGHYVWIRGSGTAQWDENGKPIFIVGSHLDISTLKEQQNDIETQRNEFDYLINNLAEVVFRLNEDFYFTFLNDYWQTTSGFTKNEALFSSFFNFFNPDDIDTVKQHFNQLLTNECKVVNFNVQLKQHTGTFKWAQIIASKLTSGVQDQSAIAGSIIDIHERTEAEKRQRELAALKADFVSMASHQFRTPLTVIYSNIELIEIYTQKIDQKIGNKLDSIALRIKNEIDRMTDLMNNILLFGKYNTNELSLNLQPVNLSKLIKNVINTYFNKLADGKTLVIQEDKRKINLDELLFTYVITNILSNALKYSEGKKKPIIKLMYTDESCAVIVKDFGIGIPEADQPKLLNSFYRASNTQTIPGSGLGLVVAKQFMELHGGSIKISSKINEGTEVTLTLPYNNA